MPEVASAFVTLLPSLKGFGSKLDKEVGAEGKRSGRGFGTAFKVGAGAVVAGGAILGGFLKSSIGEARESQKVGRLTASIIKSTGGAANLTAKQVGNLSTAISNKTGVDDETIQSGANLLLTFKNVRNEVGKGNAIFNRATTAAADLSAAGFGAMSGTSKQLGKALNDPIKGVSALGRAGVTFTEEQKAQIKTLVESGNTLAAQKIVLGEVESQVGGAAAATATGSEKMKVAWGNLKETVGTALLPVLDSVSGKLAGLFAGASKGFGPFMASVGKVASNVKSFLTPVVTTVQKMFGAFMGGGKTLEAVKVAFHIIGTTISTAFGGGGKGGVSSAVAGFKSLASTIGTNLVPVAAKVGAFFRDVILPAFTRLAVAVITNVVPVLQTAAGTFRNVILPAVIALATYLFTKLAPIFTTLMGIIITKVIPGVAAVARFLYGTLYPAIVKIVIAVAKNLKPVFDQLVATIRGTVLPMVTRLLAKLAEWWPTIKKVIVVVVAVIGWVLKLAAAILGKVLPPLIRFVAWLLVKVVGAVVAVIGVVIKIIGWIISFATAIGKGVSAVVGFVKSIKEKFNEAKEWVSGLPGRIGKAIGSLTDTLVDKGKDLITGLWDGIKSMGGWIKDKIIGFVKDKIPGPVAKVLGIGSPSKVMAKQAKWIPAGMAKGIEANGHQVQRAMTRVAGRIQTNAPTLDSTVAMGGGPSYGGGQQFRGTLGIDRDGVAYIHGVSRAEVHTNKAAQDAADRAAAMSL